MLSVKARPSSDRKFLVGILLLNWGLLLGQLADRSLWVDEFLTLQMIQGGFAQVIQAAIADIHPPLYFLALRLWTLLVGTSDFSLRWFSVAVGFTGLVLFSVLVRRWIGRQLVLPTTLFLALSPAFIEFSRMARYYSLLLALGLLSTLILLYAIQVPSWKTWLAYTLTGASLLYTFYPTGILLLAHGIIVLAAPPRRVALKSWCVATCLAGITFVPWLVYVAWGQALRMSGASGAAFAHTGLGTGLGIAASFYTFSVGETIFPWNPVTWLGLGAIAIFVFSSLRRAWHEASPWLYLFLIGILFLSLVTSFVSVSTPFLNVPVRGLLLLPYLLIVIAMGMTKLNRRTRLIGAIALVGVWSISLWNYYAGEQFLNPIYLTPSKQAAEFVQRHIAAGDLVVTDMDSIVGHYLPADQVPSQLYTDQVDEIRATIENKPPQRIWLVWINRDQTENNSSLGTVRQLVVQDYRLEQTTRWLPIDPIYRQVKDYMLRRESYDYRLVIELFSRNKISVARKNE